MASLGCSRTASDSSQATNTSTWQEHLVDIEKRGCLSMAGVVNLTNGEGGTALVWNDRLNPLVDGAVFG